MDDWRFSADELNRIGEKVKAAGMTFGYHNHDCGVRLGGRRGLL